MIRCCAVGVMLLLAGCDDGGGASQLRVELIRASGDNAAQSITGTLRVEVEQGGTPLMCPAGPCMAEISAGTFDLALPIQSLTERTVIQATIAARGGEPADRIGAVAPFAVFGEGLDTGELPVRLVMEPASSCAALDAAPVSSPAADLSVLSPARRDAAVVSRRNSALVVGGTGANADAATAVDFYDRVVAELRPPMPRTPARVGAARGLALSEDVSLVVGDVVYLYSVQPGTPITVGQVPLHEGAGYGSALAPLRGASPNGGVVVGGGRVAAVTWLSATGGIRQTTSLAVARAFAAAGGLSAGVLVAGGAGAGGPVAEWLQPTADGVEIASVDLPDGASGGWIAVSPDGGSALWIGFSVNGTPSADTHLFRGCPACTVAAGPRWETARAGASATSTAAGRLWIVGGDDSARVDLVEWDGDTPRIVAGPSLTRPRAGAMVFEHASGVVTVSGGEGPEGWLADIEHCTPARLDPL